MKYSFLKKYPKFYNFLKFLYIKLLHLISFIQIYKISKNQNLYLNLGSGPKKGNSNWINIDLYGADINWDLTRGMPFKDNTVDKIYSSHMLEHIPFKQLKKFISECHRVLKPEGELLIAVPNARFYIEHYMNKKNFKDKKDMFHPAIVQTGSWIDQINYLAYLDGLHHYMFDEENLINTLSLVNFKSVKLRNFDINIDKEKRRRESIYARAIK